MTKNPSTMITQRPRTQSLRTSAVIGAMLLACGMSGLQTASAQQVGGAAAPQVRVKVQVFEVNRSKLVEVFGTSTTQTPTGPTRPVAGVADLLDPTNLALPPCNDPYAYNIVNSEHAANQMKMFQQRDLAKAMAELTLCTPSEQSGQVRTGYDKPIPLPDGTQRMQLVGTECVCTPHVQQDGRIHLDMRIYTGQEHELGVRGREIDTGTAGTGLYSGQTLALSGLVQVRESGLHRGVPWISDIPLLGRAFRRVETRRDEVELLVLVTPEIVPASDTNTAATATAYNSVHITTPNPSMPYQSQMYR